MTLLLFGVAASACVTTGTFDKQVAELDKLRADHDRAAAERERDLKAQIDALTSQREDLRKRVDDMTTLAGELRSRLEKLGQNVDKLTSEKGQLAQVLADAKARLEDLRKQKAAAEARAATFRNLVARLKSMIDAGQLKVVIRDGRMLIALPNDVLFDSGKTNIKPDGQTALAQVAKAHGASKTAKRASMSRAGLYKTLSKKGNPEFKTFMGVLSASSLEMHFKPAA